MSRAFHGLCFCTAFALQGQVPLLMDGAERLRRQEIRWALPPELRSREAEEASPSVILQAGSVLIASPEERWVPQSLGSGLGTVFRGGGVAAGAEARWGGLEAEAVGLFLHTPSGGDIGRLFTGHLAYTSPGGWRLSLEQEPMKWGFGPLGGHLLGTSFQPFPKLRITTPAFRPRLGACTLGRWQFDWFTGRLESDRPIPAWQHSYWTLRAQAGPTGRDASRPYQSGFRISAEFLDRIEMNFGVTSMWGGIGGDGRDRMAGNHWSDYVLASLGGENILVAEASGKPDLSHFHNFSNGIASLEIRARSARLARWFGAEGAYWYLERDGENFDWRWKDFLRKPWSLDDKNRPGLSGPTHALGLQLHWSRWQLGVEYRNSDTRQELPTNYQTYESGVYPAGHSRLGDCMGFMLGGNYRLGILSLDIQPATGTRLRAVVAAGARAFMDSLALWKAAHPGQGDPRGSRVLLAELGLQQALPSQWRWGVGLGLKREEHVDFASGTVTGCNLTLSLVKRFAR